MEYTERRLWSRTEECLESQWEERLREELDTSVRKEQTISTELGSTVSLTLRLVARCEVRVRTPERRMSGDCGVRRGWGWPPWRMTPTPGRQAGCLLVGGRLVRKGLEELSLVVEVLKWREEKNRVRTESANTWLSSGRVE